MAFVITCGDEGVQINEGTRLAFIGSGYQLDGFDAVVPTLKKLFPDGLTIAPAEENDWIREKLDVVTWEQTNASAQQHIESLADQIGIDYVKIIPFADPKELGHGIKGHMVRPHDIHIANKICFTVGGGEQVYNLGQYLISADWVSDVSEELVKQLIAPQIAYYEKLAGGKQLMRVLQEEGVLGEEKAQKNKSILESLGFISVS